MWNSSWWEFVIWLLAFRYSSATWCKRYGGGISLKEGINSHLQRASAPDNCSPWQLFAVRSGRDMLPAVWDVLLWHWGETKCEWQNLLSTWWWLRVRCLMQRYYSSCRTLRPECVFVCGLWCSLSKPQPKKRKKCQACLAFSQLFFLSRGLLIFLRGKCKQDTNM